MNKNLVILRCGRSSLHAGWLHGKEERNWDLVMCPFQDMEPEPASIIPPFHVTGQKWLGIHRLLAEWPEWRQYDYIWLPDDDLIADSDIINELFNLSRKLNTLISAPSLTENSFYSHEITMRNSNFFARAVTFIEIMMPCLRRDVLEQSLPLIEHSKTGYGWGMDFVWPVMLDYDGLVIFDSIAVQHTRPIGTTRDSAIVQQGNQEFAELTKRYRAKPIYKTRGGWSADMQYRNADGQGFLLDYLNGYRYLIERHEHLFRTFVDRQNTPIPTEKFAESALFIGDNVALGKPALVSSVSEWSRSQTPELEAAGANDGNIQGGWGFHTAQEDEPWWQVDLLGMYAVKTVKLYNRMDLKERCTRVSLLGSSDGQDWTVMATKLDDSIFGGADGRPYVFRFRDPFVTRFVRVALIGNGILHLDEIEVYGTLST